MSDGLPGGPQIEIDAECVLRDGTILRADIYRPEGDGPWPVLINRTPYDKSSERYRRLAKALADRGYIAVVQDIRGRSRSEGIWYSHMSAKAQDVESDDGYDTVEWAARLPGADGQVGTFGNSYPSFSNWRLAIAQPPSLKALFTSGFPVRMVNATSGIFETGLRLRWMHQMAVSTRQRAGDLSYPQSVAEANFHWDHLLRGKWLWQVPLAAIPDALFGEAAALQRQYWEEISQEFFNLDQYHHLVQVPTCTLTGWWDRLSDASYHYTGMVQNGPAHLRDKHRLIIGPWVHSVEAKADWTGPRSYGPEARLDLAALITRWYDHHLKGLDTGLAQEKPVQLFVVNENRWRGFANWPLAETVPLDLFLGSEGAANTPAGDGVLLRSPPTSGAPSDSYVYDPKDPVPSLVDPDGQASADDQRPLATRQDILVYATPVEEEIELIGAPSCEIWVTVDRPDTDIVVRLIEVDQNGLAVNLSQGITRARYRNGYEKEELLTPGEPVLIKVRMLPIGVRLLKGSQLRLDVTSSDFPNYDRNHNTGKPFHTDPDLLPAEVRVLHDAKHPSKVTLPLLR